MPQPSKIPLAFAASGDKNVIPESTETTGLASWRDGFPAITSAPFSEGGIAPKRADFNGIFNALSLATVWQQQGGFYAYDATTDYEVGNVVEYNNDLYKCITANGPSSTVKAPTDTTVWSKVMTAADAAALYLPLSGGTMTGDLTLSKQNNFTYIYNSNPNYGLGLYGGLDYNQGASVTVFGKNATANSGSFRVRAHNGSVGKDLIGNPDGTLTWNGNAVITSDFMKNSVFQATLANAGPTSFTYHMETGISLILVKRDNNAQLFACDWWNNSPVLLFSTGSTLATVTKTGNNNITVTKNTSSGPTCLALVINPKIAFN